MRTTPVLDTARLRLRERTVGDAEALFPSYADAELMTYWSHAPHVSIEQTRAKLAEPSEAWRGWAITLHGDDTAIGFVAAGEKRQGNVSEIGYMLARAHWGGGIAREAVTAVLDQLFRVEGQRRVFADTDPENDPSNALLKALGFTLEGRLRAEWETHLGVRDTFLWGLLREEWIAPKAPVATPPPDLSDPAQRAAYRREVRAAGRPLRFMGLGLAVAAALLAGLRARYWPHVPVAVPLFLLGVAALHMLAGILIRSRYHQARMRG